MKHNNGLWSYQVIDFGTRVEEITDDKNKETPPETNAIRRRFVKYQRKGENRVHEHVF